MLSRGLYDDRSLSPASAGPVRNAIMMGARIRVGFGQHRHGFYRATSVLGRILATFEAGGIDWLVACFGRTVLSGTPLSAPAGAVRM